MELIKDRLSHILRAKNLTATQFAELMQIQPSNVSHLLSGRNKPSLDFLIKLKEVFPEYNYEWIILGKKPITTNDSNIFSKESLFDKVEMTKYDENVEVADKNFVLKSQEVDTDDNQVDTIIPEITNNITTGGLKQIIYVYEDHTFEVYNLRK
jgi:transcriptional regulator with XRE-family HTH domain